MKKIILLLALLLLITACGKEDIPKQQPVPQRPEIFYVPPPKPVEVEPMPEPEQVKEVKITEPEPEPEPLPPVHEVPAGRPSCKVLIKTGKLYTYADVEKGEISLQDFSDLKKCYPYFSEEQANTDAMCCII